MAEKRDIEDSGAVRPPADPKVVAKVTELLSAAKLSVRERSDLFALAGAMAEGSDFNEEDFLLTYLSGRRDWRADFAKMFGYEPAKKSTATKPAKKNTTSK